MLKLMDMKRIRRHISESWRSDPEDESICRRTEKKGGFVIHVRSMGFLVAASMAIAVVVMIFLVCRDPPSHHQIHHAPQSLGSFHANSNSHYHSHFHGDHTPRDLKQQQQLRHEKAFMLEDKLLGGLLAPGWNEGRCLSRYQSVLYRKASTFKPSSFLLAKLRNYEALHERCGPKTGSYNKTLNQLKSDDTFGPSDCKYLIWISFSGLGNRILTLVSAFLYALLTERVLLVDRGTDMSDLFCEPFPENSWLLPLDFPLQPLSSLNKESPRNFGTMLKNNVINQNMNNESFGLLPAFAYLHLVHDYDDYDKLFFCEQDQLLLEKIPWLILRSDNYFVPSLFLIPLFEEDLSKLFPVKDTVFHHLGRYLLHPSNSVWGLITRFYHSYLANAEERIGIQIRVFESQPGPFQYVLDQILACTLGEKLLPNITREPVAPMSRRSRAILLTSLSSGYYENIRNMYWEHPAVNGEIVSVYQPSHEEFQQTEKQMHNMKAWAEMYLLSLSDMLVTSSWSTFGYVAQGLGGLKPWILFKPENQTAPDPPCSRAMSMEPCFHAPPFYDCKAKVGIDTGVLVPHVRHCEDMSWGLKLVHPNDS